MRMIPSTMLSLIMLLALLAPGLAMADTAAGQGAAAPAPRVKVRATGQAPTELVNARETAVQDALRRCVEAAGGVAIASVSETQDAMLIRDVIYAKTMGFIERYDVLAENPDQEGLFTVRVEAIVTRGEINTNIEAFKTLLKRKGRPRVVIVGTTDGKPLDARLTTQLQTMLDRRGIHVVDADRLNQQQRQDAQVAAKADGDLKKAALIAMQSGADILAVVSLQGERLPVENIYGVESHSVNAVGIVKLIRADTAQVLGSEVIERRVTGDTAQTASRKAASEVTTLAMDSSIRRIAMHWLEEVDQRGGQEVIIVLHKVSFKRMASLVENLRKVGGVKDVIIDRTDEQSTGQLRVVTNSSAADVALVLSKLDPKMEVMRSTGNRLEVR